VEESTVAEVAAVTEDVAVIAEEVAAVSEEVVVTPEDVVPAAAEAEAPAAEEPLGEDLKSRIEETRRRIREELERPFAVVDQDEGPAEAGDLGIAATSAYAAAEYVAPEPDVAPAPVIGEPMYVNAGATDATAAPEATDASAPNGNGSDYDAMRARIELTRSRLKAKAFDAMMAGESSLLRRDPEGTATPRKSVTVDNEIEQTVESTLREEDD
jgi:hypothetical protein